MGKDKLRRFAENDTFTSMYQPSFEEVFSKDYRLKGKWHSGVFGNNNPIVLELGCGRGEYTIEMAKEFPEKNFIGIDIKGARLWRGAKTAHEENMRNVAFVRTRIEFIKSVFGEGEISEIWITFPDPQIKRLNKRLTSAKFIESYYSFLNEGALIHLKTDSRFLHEYTAAMAKENGFEILEEIKDIYGEGKADRLLSIKTHYEKQYIGKGLPITYLCFRTDKNKISREPEWDPGDIELR
jgi:tRNA (guanine-N7-)-methyltransferase